VIFGDFGGVEPGGARVEVTRLVIVLVGRRKIKFELWPSLVFVGPLFPNLAVVNESTRPKDELVGDVKALLRGVWCLACRGIFDGVVDLFEKGDSIGRLTSQWSFMAASFLSRSDAVSSRRDAKVKKNIYIYKKIGNLLFRLPRALGASTPHHE
jgi:hypothetical protein